MKSTISSNASATRGCWPAYRRTCPRWSTRSKSKGWDLDYYMTCVYERHRSPEDLKKLLGHVPIPAARSTWRKTRRGCSRRCADEADLPGVQDPGRRPPVRYTDSVEQAFRETFQGIKPHDAVIVGIYDRYSDQPGEDAGFVRQYGNGQANA